MIIQKGELYHRYGVYYKLEEIKEDYVIVKGITLKSKSKKISLGEFKANYLLV